MRLLSDDNGHEVKCRDPRCSFTCRCNWAKKEAAVMERFCLDKLPPTTRYVRGRLALPPDATPDQHKAALAKYQRALRELCDETNNEIHLARVVHATDKTNKHYDYMAYCWHPISDRQFRRIMKDAARRAGFKSSCKMIDTAKKLRGWINYIYKVDQIPKEGERYVYLLARDRTHAHDRTRGFFQCFSEDELWGECKADWYAPIKVSNKTTEHPETPVKTVETVIIATLPDNPDEAASSRISIGKIAWLTGIDRQTVFETCGTHPDIECIDGCYWRRTRFRSGIPWLRQIFPNGEVPYHREYFPLPDEADERPARPAVKPRPADEYTEDEFMHLLDEAMS